jgi:hypothetical protein
MTNIKLPLFRCDWKAPDLDPDTHYTQYMQIAHSCRTKTIFNSVFSTQANEENSKKRLVELQESVDAAKKEKNQLIQESEEAKAQLRNEMDLLKQRMEQLVDEGADKQEKIERLEAKRTELIAQVRSSYQRVLICIFFTLPGSVADQLNFGTDRGTGSSDPYL